MAVLTQGIPENRFLLIASYSYGSDIHRRNLIRNTTLRYGRQVNHDSDARPFYTCGYLS